MTLKDRNSISGTITFYHPIAFWLGSLAVVVGVCLHLPMFVHAAPMGYRMAGMPMDSLMATGMILIVFGTLVAGYGLMPPGSLAWNGKERTKGPSPNLHVRAMDDARLSPAHVKMLAVLAVALVVDVMKPATLGFIVPGAAEEHGLPKSTVAILPFVALIGTMIGSVIWGFLGDLLGRRGSILLASLMFIGTSICGAMPTFEWNVFMCFMMGLSAGGLLPIAFTLLAETVPARQRSWLLVLIGGIGTVGGYLAAAGSAALLEPHFGWRIMWFLGLPTGLALILLNRHIPESPRFLALNGRSEEIRKVMANFGAEIVHEKSHRPPLHDAATGTLQELFKHPNLPLTLSLNFFGIAWGLVNFAFLLWLPTNLRNGGLTVGISDMILANSAIISFIGVPLAAWLHYRWSTKRSLVLFTAVLMVSLTAFIVLGDAAAQHTTALTLLLVALLVSTNSIVAMLLPYSAEVYPNHIRASGVGIVAGSTKMGGVIGLGAVLAAIIPGLAASAAFVAVPTALSAMLLNKNGME